MKTIAFVSQEDNSGKTTLAIHMAEMAVRAGKKVVLVDTERQGSMMQWFKRRRERHNETLSALEVQPGALSRLFMKSKRRNTDLVIIDTSAQSSETMEIAFQMADLAYFPCRPKLFSTDKIPYTRALPKPQKTPVFILPNFCRQGELAHITRTQLQRYDYPVLDFGISDNPAFKTSISDGRCVLEDDPAGQATRDIKNLFGFTKIKLRF